MICSHACFGDRTRKLGTVFVTLSRSFFLASVVLSVKRGDSPGLIRGGVYHDSILSQGFGEEASQPPS